MQALKKCILQRNKTINAKKAKRGQFKQKTCSRQSQLNQNTSQAIPKQKWDEENSS